MQVNSFAVQLFSLTKSQLSIADSTAERTKHTLRSSNLPFYIAVWDAAKSSAGLVTFSKRFFWALPPLGSKGKGATEPNKASVLVDIVAQGGLEWVKVSTTTETRLLFDLAKAGWEAADSSSDASSEDEDGGLSAPDFAADGHSSPSNSSIELVRLAAHLQRASRANLLRYRTPSIRFVLPKISTSPSPPIRTILSQILATGATIECGPSFLPYPSINGKSPSPTSVDNGSSNFEKLLRDPHASLTPTLNIDCTILLALVSDLSHFPRTPHSPTHHQAITRQITLEVSDPLLPDSLYPALEGHDLVCTDVAAARMREIVQQIGTESECQRAWLLLGHEISPNPEEDITTMPPSIIDRSVIHTLLSAHSEYPIPSDLRLPIKIITSPASASPSAQIEMSLQKLPPIARAVAAELSAINQSVFLYGWEAGITTISSNRTVAKLIEGIIGEENERRGREEEKKEAVGRGPGGWNEGETNGGKRRKAEAKEDVTIIHGPEIWLCSTARSLVGKEKGRKR